MESAEKNQTENGEVKSAAEKAMNGEMPEKKVSEVKKEKDIQKPESFSVVIEKHFEGNKVERQVVLSRFKNFVIAGVNENFEVNIAADGLMPMLSSFICEVLHFELVQSPMVREKAARLRAAMQRAGINMPATPQAPR